MIRRIIRLALTGLAALALGAGVASSASALTLYNQSTSAPLPVGSTLTGTLSGTMTFSGSFFGFTMTIQCTGAPLTAVLTSNGGSTVTASVTAYSWTGCSSNLKAPCVTPGVGLPWNATNQGGLVWTSTSAVALGFGTNGAIDVTDCFNGLTSTCTLTGATASLGGVVNAVAGTWSTTSPQFSVNGGMKAKVCTSSGVILVSNHTFTSGGANVGVRTP